MLMADDANAEIQKLAPWTLTKDEARREELQQICTTFLNLFRQLTVYLKPVLPGIAAQIEHFLNVPPLNWDDARKPLLGHQIRAYTPLITRIEPKAIAAMLAEETAATAPEPSTATPTAVSTKKPTPVPTTDTNGIETFGKNHLYTARIAPA